MINKAKLTSDVIKTYSDKGVDWTHARNDRSQYLIAVDSNEPKLKRVDQITIQLVRMLPRNGIVLDFGFGPEARDIVDIREFGEPKELQIIGAELVLENIRSAINNPSLRGQQGSYLQGRAVQADIVQGIPFADESLSAVILSSVIQHLTPGEIYKVVLPNIFRKLKSGGFLQLIFKRSNAETQLIAIEDQTMGKIQRKFYLYNCDELIENAKMIGFEVFMGDDNYFGGLLKWTDQNRPIPYAGIYLWRPPGVGSK